MASPTQEGNKKLERVLKYLNGTGCMGIALRQTLDHPVAYVDASYGVHKEFKSQTGVFITIFLRIYAKRAKYLDEKYHR